MKKPIQQKIGSVALVVENYDDAIEFYTHKLNFELIEDTDLGDGKRWVLISPPNGNGTNLLLAQASNEEQQKSVGNQTGGRVFLFLHTNDFWRDYEEMKKKASYLMKNHVKKSMVPLLFFKIFMAQNGIY